MTIAVLQYPGSNCDLDTLEILQKVVRTKATLVWHEALKNDDYDGYILPGGFSYGDYLRAGSIAAHSPSLDTVRTAAKHGKPILGICNGFQTLVEAGLLPGAILRNQGLRFVCKWINLRVENRDTPFTRTLKNEEVLRAPIAHNEGRFYLGPDELDSLEKNRQVVLRYVDKTGETTPDSNPNGSVNNIAGVCNQEENVMGLMPHPERASMPELSPFNSSDGVKIFRSMAGSIGKETTKTRRSSKK